MADHDKDQPDPFTLAWFKGRIFRIDTTLDRQANDLRDQFATINELAEKIKQLLSERKASLAKVGELVARVEELESWRKKIVPWLMERLPPKENGKDGDNVRPAV